MEGIILPSLFFEQSYNERTLVRLRLEGTQTVKQQGRGRSIHN